MIENINRERIVTAEMVESAVKGIAMLDEYDDEYHVLEDELHIAVLNAIAEGRALCPASCAAAALETLETDHVRWYA